jgi:hypothetical protein
LLSYFPFYLWRSFCGRYLIRKTPLQSRATPRLAELELQSRNLLCHRTRSAPSFISCACAVALSNRDWKSAPPCSQAISMADFILPATAMNFDGLSSLWLRKVTTYVLATAGGKIARNYFLLVAFIKYPTYTSPRRFYDLARELA